MNNHGITPDNLLRTFPEVLKNDKKLLALAKTVAKLLSLRVNEIDKLQIYTQIDNLPEDLVDILASDFKVDWYGYNYDLEVKRGQLKDSFIVHRFLGTKNAMEKAMGDLYPGTQVEEWFDYDGDPFYFRILLDVTDQKVNISHDELLRTINMFKPIRSHLQDDTVIYRSRAEIEIQVSTGYTIYNVRLCGTYPVRATQGAITNEDIILDTDSGGVAYAVPMSGEIKTGSHPAVATQGEIQSSGIEVGANGNGVAYSAPMCGTAPGSLM